MFELFFLLRIQVFKLKAAALDGLIGEYQLAGTVIADGPVGKLYAGGRAVGQ